MSAITISAITISQKSQRMNFSSEYDHISNLENPTVVFHNEARTELVNDVDLGFDSSPYETLVFIYRYGRTGGFYQRTFYKDQYNLATLDTIYGTDAYAYFVLVSGTNHLKVSGGGTNRPFLYKVLGYKVKT